MALESDFVPFRVLSHPVRMSRATKAVPLDLDELLLELAQIARRRNKALELNGSDIDRGGSRAYPQARDRMLKGWLHGERQSRGSPCKRSVQKHRNSHGSSKTI